MTKLGLIDNRSSRPDDQVREILDFVAAQIQLERGTVAVRIADGRGNGYAFDSHKPKWAGRHRHATRLSILAAGDPDEDRYGRPLACWHSTRARQLAGEHGLEHVYQLWAEAYARGDRRFGRWPIYTINDWREALVHLAAHEFAHLLAFDRDRQRGRLSEIECELTAERVLEEWRATHPDTKEDTTTTTLEPEKAKDKKRGGGRNGNTPDKPKTLSAIKAAEEILRKEGKPLHVKELTQRILAMPNTKLGGKTPDATVGAILAVDSKKTGSIFRRTKPGTYTIRKGK